MANSQETSGYFGQKHGGYGHEYADSLTGCSCFRWFSFGWSSGEVGGNHFLLQERGVGPQKETSLLAKFKNLTSKIHKKVTSKRTNQFLYSPETYALNFASELEREENGDLMHSFSSRFVSRPLINDQQRRMASL
ncbi:uncharacterized protein LOC142546873 [Primulina tabacum]|uniref:uncharacterized protein LOC142546873 n=1 Tax=Primulina tabacum TaxID=48773 RepID=UPI003F5ACDF6